MIIGRLLVAQRLTAAGHVNTFHRAKIYLLESRQEEINLFSTIETSKCLVYNKVWS